MHIPDEEFFQSWTPELAWLIGVIWADGNLTRNCVEVCSKDSDLIEFVDSLTGADNIRLKNGGAHLRTYFSSVTVANFLRGLGLTERKSLTVRWPQGLPKDLEGHFMRGVIDGDGWVSLRQARKGQVAPDLVVGFCTASTGFLQDVSGWLDREGIAHSTREKKRGLWSIEVKRQDACRKLYAILYPRGTSETGLIRKSAAYHFWIDHPRRLHNRSDIMVNAGDHRSPA